MRIRIDDITRGTFSLPTAIDNRDKYLRIGVKSIGCWVGFYNIYEEQTCRWAREGENSREFKIKSGLYSFRNLSNLLKRRVEGLVYHLIK